VVGAGINVDQTSFRRDHVMSGEQRLIRPDRPAPRLRSDIDFGLMCFALLMTAAIVVSLACPSPEWTPVAFLIAP
jgi:hypothetical protein